MPMGMQPPLQHQPPMAPPQYHHPPAYPSKRQRMDVAGNTDQDDSMSGGSGSEMQAAMAMHNQAQGMPNGGSRVIECETMDDGYK